MNSTFDRYEQIEHAQRDAAALAAAVEEHRAAPRGEVAIAHERSEGAGSADGGERVREKAQAWDAISEILTRNARGESHASAADVCAEGFSLQEQLDARALGPTVQMQTDAPDAGAWLEDTIQFPRLLAEISATQDDLDIGALCESMDLDAGQVNELFDRAEAQWERIKAAQAGAA